MELNLKKLFIFPQNGASEKQQQKTNKQKKKKQKKKKSLRLITRHARQTFWLSKSHRIPKVRQKNKQNGSV